MIKDSRSVRTLVLTLVAAGAWACSRDPSPRDPASTATAPAAEPAPSAGDGAIVSQSVAAASTNHKNLLHGGATIGADVSLVVPSGSAVP